MARKTPSLRQKSLNLDFYGLSVLINFKTNVKAMRLRVGKDAKITLSMPFYSTQKMALAFLESHKIWLENAYKKALLNLPKDDEMKFLGQIYKIKFNESVNVPFFEDKFIITPNLKALERFKKVRAKELFLELVSYYQPHINKPVSRIVIRDSKTRWGSCNHKKGYINLSLRLIEKPLSAVSCFTSLLTYSIRIIKAAFINL